MLLTFTQYLADLKITATNSDGTLTDRALTQNQFSNYYTDWLKYVFSSSAVHDWIETNSSSGFTYNTSNFIVNINQNGSLLPTITNSTGQTLEQSVLDELFGAKDTVTLLTGKTVQDRSYVYGFEGDALQEMFAPKVSGPVTGTATEDGGVVSLNALANVTDADTPLNALSVVAPATLPAGVTWDAATHSFKLDTSDAAYQSLAAGATLPVTVEYQVSDGTFTTKASVSWTVTGVNDAASISGTFTGAVAEDASAPGESSTASGKLAVSDVDKGESVFKAVAANDLAKDYGSFTFDETTGAWNFTIDNDAAQSLGAAQTVHQSLTVWSKDGTASQTITVDVVGKNDAAVIGGQDTGAVTEDGTTTKSGLLSVSDPDANQDHFQANTFTGTYGSLNLAQDGHWTYTLDNASAAVQGLTAEDHKTETFTVQSADGTTHDVVITVNGADDVDGDTSHDFDVYDVNGNVLVTSNSSSPGNPYQFNGSNGADTIVGNNNALNPDTINAKDGGDTVYGRAGNDDIKGQSDNDTIYGGSGDDNIAGGAGADNIWGGSGNDTFIFGTGDSTVTSMDTINDFHHGFDKIDVSALDAYTLNPSTPGDQAFAWGGTTATAHSVWFTEVNGNTFVYADTDGNTATAEFAVKLAGINLALTSKDFIL